MLGAIPNREAETLTLPIHRPIDWRECLACGKRYVVRLPAPKERTLEALEEAAKTAHRCRTERQERALEDYSEAE